MFARLTLSLLGSAVVLTAVAAPSGAAQGKPSGSRPADPACAQFLSRLSGVPLSTCQAARLEPSGARSHKGQPIFWRDVHRAGQGAAASQAPLRVLVVGAIHGDEPTSAALALHWIGFAGKTGPGLRPVHWRFIPVLNPDGLLARKPTRVNARGVDLNRNFPTPGWETDAPVYWAQRTRKDPRRWPGPAPLSEPESRFLHAQMDSFRPQLIVSIHAPYGVLDFDGPHDPPERLGRLRLDRVGVFPGSLGHYGGIHQGVPVVTIELQHALRLPQEAEVQRMWSDLQRWMHTRLPEADDVVRAAQAPVDPSAGRRTGAPSP